MSSPDDRPASCCSPRRDTVEPLRRPSTGPTERPDLVPAAARRVTDVLRLDGGDFAMGDAFDEGYPADGETPVHPVTLSPFGIGATTVTNAEFAAFVDATGHRTEAEAFEVSGVFHLAVSAADDEILGRVPGTPWWLAVRGADWRHPEGSRSDLDGRADHPVVHVSWNDAHAYCRWAGGRLPTEAEWEYAARGGLSGARFAWGDELTADGAWRCNIWQGRFPTRNTEEDGYLTTAPVRAFEPNGLGLWNTAGNVWEWCADWFSAGYYRESPRRDPSGPATGQARVMRGGSFLCHDSYCNRYRVAARSSNTPDSSASNIGFRCAADGQP